MKIAFLFMIYDKIEKEDLWYTFFSNISSGKYNIYIHGKDKDNIKFENDFFKKYIIDNNYDTEWGNFSLVYLQNRLFEYALKDEENYKFILLSGSHIPLHNFNFIYDTLTKNNFGYISHYQTKLKSKIFINRYETINNIKKYSLINWHYSSQWVILNKQLATFIINKETEFNKIFDKSKFSDEYAYINYFIENNLNHHILNKKTTFISSVPTLSTLQNHRKYPHTFDNDEIDFNLIKKIKKSYLFLRKVVNTCIIDPNWIFDNTVNFSMTDSTILLNKKSYSKKINTSGVPTKKSLLQNSTKKLNTINKIKMIAIKK